MVRTLPNRWVCLGAARRDFVWLSHWNKGAEKNRKIDVDPDRAQADLLRRASRFSESADAYRAALALVKIARERAYLQKRLDDVSRAATATAGD